MSMRLYVCHQGGEFNSEPEARRNGVERELRKRVTGHPEFGADATKQNGNGCKEQEEVPMCLHITEWWSDSRGCHRMSEDAAETGLEEVWRWVAKRTGHEGVEIIASGVLIPLLGSRVKIGRMQSGAHAIWGKSGVNGGDPRKKDSMERERKRICEEKRNKGEPSWGDLIHKGKCSGVAGSEMDGAVMEQYWRRSGGLEVRENPTRVNQNGLEVVFAVGGKVLEVRRLKGKSEMKVNRDDGDERSLHEGWTGICQEVSNGEKADGGREMKTTTKSCKSGVPLEWNRRDLRRSAKGGTDEDLHEVRSSSGGSGGLD
ncbi:hypothetical protein EV363DRAFT_1392198 [Boletus edulis]|nr:hypothetical protein EV363DRAFT_1392198 [Boletus edulis]